MSRILPGTCLITGAAQGIGKSIAEAFAKSGAQKIVLVDKNVEKLKSCARELESKHSVKVIELACDVGDSSAVQKSLDSLGETLGDIRVLVNNAGYGGPFHRLNEVSDKEWHEIFATNVQGVFHFCRTLLPVMQNAKNGRVINISSIQGFLGAQRSSTYVAAKHAVIGYTRAIAAEWGAYGITCNAICPGYIDTSMGVQTEHSRDHERKVCEKTPAGRLGHPEEVASLALYLADEKSSFINGSINTIDGGFSSHIGF